MNEDELIKVACMVYWAAEHHADDPMGALEETIHLFPEIEPIAKKIYDVELKHVYGIEYEKFKGINESGYDVDGLIDDILAAGGK